MQEETNGKNMNSHYSRLLANIRELMQGPSWDVNDFIALAAEGEALRRALVLDDEAPEQATEMLKQYDAVIKKAEMPFLDNYSGLDDSLAALSEASRMPVLERDVETIAELIEGIEDYLFAAAAAWRAGKISLERVESLGLNCQKKLMPLLPHFPELWERGFTYSAVYGPDPDLPELASPWDGLGQLSDSHFQLIEELRSAKSPEHEPGYQRALKLILDATERRLGKNQQAPAAQSVVEKIKAALDKVDAVLRPVFVPDFIFEPFAPLAAHAQGAVSEPAVARHWRDEKGTVSAHCELPTKNSPDERNITLWVNDALPGDKAVLWGIERPLEKHNGTGSLFSAVFPVGALRQYYRSAPVELALLRSGNIILMRK